MPNRFALALLALCAPATLLAFCVDAAPLRWIAGLAMAVFPVTLMSLGAGRARRGPFVLLGAVLAVGLLVLLALPRGGPDVAGLPLGTLVMLFGLVPIPFAIACWAYVAGFDRELREEDLERLRKLREEGKT